MTRLCLMIFNFCLAPRIVGFARCKCWHARGVPFLHVDMQQDLLQKPRSGCLPGWSPTRGGSKPGISQDRHRFLGGGQGGVLPFRPSWAGFGVRRGGPKPGMRDPLEAKSLAGAPKIEPLSATLHAVPARQRKVSIIGDSMTLRLWWGRSVAIEARTTQAPCRAL